MEIVFLTIGLAVGFAAAWLIASARLSAKAASADGTIAELRGQLAKAEGDSGGLRKTLDEERQFKTRAETQLAEATRYFQEQKAMLEEARTRLSEAFKALSIDALKSNNQLFLDQARPSFEAMIAEARGDIGKRQQAIDELVKPLSASLEWLKQQIPKSDASLEERLRALTSAQQQLQKETGNLVTALKAPQVRGRWGEVTLHRVVELAGLSEHCDYAEQVSVTTEDGRLRPDMVVHLPSGRQIVVDSKVSLEAYLRAISAETEEQRRECLKQHAQQIRTHMQQLSSKDYWKEFEPAPEFVVMFIPGESFFAAALDCDQSLLEDGMKQRVVLATPTTLIALLRAVAYGWRQEQMAQNARAVCDLGQELFERIKVLSSHVIRLGVALKQANESYNKAVGSMESRVLPAVRKFQELGVVGGEGIPTVEPLEVAPRTLSAEGETPRTGGGDAEGASSQ